MKNYHVSENQDDIFDDIFPEANFEEDDDLESLNINSHFKSKLKKKTKAFPGKNGKTDKQRKPKKFKDE